MGNFWSNQNKSQTSTIKVSDIKVSDTKVSDTKVSKYQPLSEAQPPKFTKIKYSQVLPTIWEE